MQLSSCPYSSVTNNTVSNWLNRLPTCTMATAGTISTVQLMLHSMLANHCCSKKIERKKTVKKVYLWDITCVSGVNDVAFVSLFFTKEKSDKTASQTINEVMNFLTVGFLNSKHGKSYAISYVCAIGLVH